jgi:hypothetical protein
MRDALAVGLCFADPRGEPFAQLGGRLLVETVVDLAGVDHVAALAAADIDTVPVIAVQREPCDRKRLSLGEVFFTQLLPRPET